MRFSISNNAKVTFCVFVIKEGVNHKQYLPAIQMISTSNDVDYVEA
jgi:hypothetical protein